MGDKNRKNPQNNNDRKSEQWIEYLRERLESIESNLKFIISACIIIFGYLIVQLFYVLDEDIIPYLSEEKIEFIKLVRPGALFISIFILGLIMYLVTRAMLSRRNGIQKLIKYYFIHKKINYKNDWKYINIIDGQKRVFEFLFKKVKIKNKKSYK